MVILIKEKIKILQENIRNNPNDFKSIEEYAIALSDIGENEEYIFFQYQTRCET